MCCKPEIRFGRIRRNKGITGIYNELHYPAKRSLGFVVVWWYGGKLRVEHRASVEV
jgi:hypothetical protein